MVNKYHFLSKEEYVLIKNLYTDTYRYTEIKNHNKWKPMTYYKDYNYGEIIFTYVILKNEVGYGLRTWVFSLCIIIKKGIKDAYIYNYFSALGVKYHVRTLEGNTCKYNYKEIPESRVLVEVI